MLTLGSPRRGNMANATADNLLHDLKLSQADYNLGNTLSKLGCASVAVPRRTIQRKRTHVLTLHSPHGGASLADDRQEARSRYLGPDADLHLLGPRLRPILDERAGILPRPPFLDCVFPRRLVSTPPLIAVSNG